MGVRNYKNILILVFSICIMILGIVFASFTRSLTIGFNSVAVIPNTDFDPVHIALSSSSTSIQNNPISPTITGKAQNSAGKLFITNNTNNSSASLDGVAVVFDFSDGYASSTITYTLYVFNNSGYTAYLNSVIFDNVSGTSSTKSCEAINTNLIVADYCNKVKYSLIIGDLSIASNVSVPTSNTNINGHSLAPGASETLVISVNVSDADAAEATDDYKVEFGGFTLTYGTAD